MLSSIWIWNYGKQYVAEKDTVTVGFAQASKGPKFVVKAWKGPLKNNFAALMKR